MAGKRKAEGIALLSVYGGDDDDGASVASSSDEEDEEGDGNSERLPQDTSSPQADGVDILGSGGRASGDDREQQPATESPSGTHTASPGNPPTLQTENAAEGPTLPSSEAADGEDKTGWAVEGEGAPEPEPMELDILNDFLPPVPAEKYAGELQAKFSKYLGLKKTGKSLNEQLRNTKGYRNPDFLQSAVRHYDIDHIGSCFKKEIFDPHGYDPSDYHDAIALEIRREAERKEMERRQTQRVDFVRNSIQTAVAVVKPMVPPIVHKVTTTVTTTETTVKTEGRSSKKSKWDKVDVEGSRSTNAADAIAAASAHAALLTATANAGAGYASFAQQRRREAEEKSRVSEKVLLSSASKPDRKTERS